MQTEDGIFTVSDLDYSFSKSFGFTIKLKPLSVKRMIDGMFIN